MSSILQIETATTVCSIALAENSSVLAFREVDQRNVHAEKITVFIEEILKQANKDFAGLDAIAVSSGPGSYTGLRIGVSAAKGLCFALDRPLISVDTLAAMADGFILQNTFDNKTRTLLCPMIDARRMEVFTAVFDIHGNVIKSVSAEIIDGDSFSDLLRDHQILFFGDGAEKCTQVLGAHPNVRILKEFTNSATHLTKRAAEKFAANKFENVAYFEPYYLKDFIAGKKAL
jgi:tRNA threonylcarbamoyladenosine biosynthesis protein TsaB